MLKKQRLEMQAGVKYRGYGYLNAFGEFEFTPEQTGSRQGRRKLVKEGDCYSIAETSNSRIVHISLPKDIKGLALIKSFMVIINEIVAVFRDYDL